MAKPNTSLVPSEEKATEQLERRLRAAGRAPTLVLAGPVEARLARVLHAFTDSADGQFLDLATPEVLADLRNGPPLYGRDFAGRLSDSVVRQFLLRKASELRAPLVAVHIPSVLWKIMAETEARGPRRLLGSLREWASPCALVLSYPLGADPSSLSTEELARLLAHHLVEIQLTEAERRYLESEWEEGTHGQH